MTSDELDVARLSAADVHDVTAGQRAAPVVDGDLASLQRAGEPVEELIDHGLLALLRHPEVDHGFVGADAELTGTGDGAIHRGGLEQFLRGDTADVQARAPDLVVLDEPDVEAGTGA